MAIVVNVESFNRIAKELRGMPDEIPKAISRAVNDTIRQTRTIVGREVRAGYAVKQADIYKSLKMYFSSAKNYAEIRGSLDSYSFRFPLYIFGKSGIKVGAARKTPVMVEVRRGSRKQVNDAFPAMMQ